jgi:hypothetical protein
MSATREAGFGDLLLAEWTKIRSVRSTLWSLAVLVVATIGLTAALMAIIVVSWSQLGGPARALIAADPVGRILAAGTQFGQLAVCVLGVMVISSEYSTGVIRASLLAVPGRTPMLIAKGLVFGVLMLIAGEVVAFPAFFVGAAILRSRVPVTLSDPGVSRAVLAVGPYLAVLGLFSMAIGALIRHTAAAITAVVGLVFVVEPVAGLIPGTWGAHIHAYLPTAAGAVVTRAARESGQVLSTWQGFGVFCGWTAALFAVAGFLLYRRDA